MKARIWLGCMAAACSLATATMAQNGTDAPQASEKPTLDVPQFKMEVRRVLVDVVVTDKQGHPVRGLKKSDFIVKEDKKPQKILSFDSHNGNKVNYVPPKLPPLPVNTFANVAAGPEHGPLYVLYYDMVNTPQIDQMSFREQLLKFVDQAPPGVRMAIFVNAMRLQMVQGFTSDHALLKAAILSKGPGPYIPPVFIFGRNFGRNDVGGVLSNMDFMAQYLAGMPGRKNLIWLASRFPIPVGPTVYGGGGGAGIRMGLGAGGPDVLFLTDLVWQMYHRTFEAMARSQIALYPVDLHGIGYQNSMVDQEYMDSIAEATGGQAYYANNRANELMLKAVDDGANYYSLSYEPPSKNFTTTIKDKQERDIEVSLRNQKKGQYILHYRQFYYALPNDAVDSGKTTNALLARNTEAKEHDTLYANIEHGAPTMHGLLFTAHLATDGGPVMATEEQMKQLEASPVYFKVRKPNEKVTVPKPVKLQKYVIEYGVIDPHLKSLAAQDGRRPVMEFAAAAYDSDGQLLNSILNKGTPSSQKVPKAKTDELFHAAQELEAPPDTAFIRMLVRDKLNDRTGTLEIKLPLKPVSDVANSQQGAGATGLSNTD